MSRVGRLIDQCGRSRDPAFAFSGLDVWIAQLQQQVFDRLCRNLVHRLRIVGQAFAQGRQDRRQRLAQPCDSEPDGHGDRFFLEPVF